MTAGEYRSRGGDASSPWRQLVEYLSQPAVLVAGMVGLLVGQAHIFELFWPFGPAYLAAVRTQIPRATPAALAGLSGGAAASLDPWHAVQLLLIYGLFLAAAARRQWQARYPGPVRVWPPPRRLYSALVLLVLLPTAVRTPGGVWLDAFPETLVASLGEGVLVAGFYLLYRPAVTLFHGRPYGRQLNDEERLTVILLLATAAAGLTPWRLGHLAPAAVLASFLVLAAAIWGHRTAAPAAGAAVGTVLGLQTGAVPALAGIYAVAGLAAGLTRPLGRFPALVAYAAAGALAAAGLAATTLTGQPGAGMPSFLWGAVAAILLLTLVPEEKVHGLWAFLAEGGRLLVDARDNAEVSRAGNQPQEGGPAGPAAQAAALLEALAVAMAPAAASRQRPEGTADLTVTIDRVSASICAGCPQRVACWQRHFFRTYGKLGQLVALAEEQLPLTTGDVPDELIGWCRRKEALVGTVNRVMQHHLEASRVERDLAAGRRLLVAQLEEVAGLIGEWSLGPSGAGPPVGLWRRPAPARPPHPPGLRVVTDSVQLAKSGQEVPGDSWLARELDDGRFLIMISDGMGGGRTAREESQLILDLVQRLLEAGMPRHFSLRAVNTVLRLRAAGERVATLDLALIDCYTGEAELIKLGAAPTFIFRPDGTCRVLQSETLPMGILREVDVAKTHHVLAPGDLLVMVSDGVLDAERRPERRVAWIQEYVRNLGSHDPQLLARSLLAQARAKSGNQRRDDMLVVAAQVMDRAQRQRAVGG